MIILSQEGSNPFMTRAIQGTLKPELNESQNCVVSVRLGATNLLCSWCLCAHLNAVASASYDRCSSASVSPPSNLNNSVSVVVWMDVDEPDPVLLAQPLLLSVSSLGVNE